MPNLRKGNHDQSGRRLAITKTAQQRGRNWVEYWQLPVAVRKVFDALHPGFASQQRSAARFQEDRYIDEDKREG